MWEVKLELVLLKCTITAVFLEIAKATFFKEKKAFTWRTDTAGNTQNPSTDMLVNCFRHQRDHFNVIIIIMMTL